MKKIISILIIIVFYIPLNGKTQTNLPSKHLQLIIGKSKHGTGDVNGISLNTTYSKYFKRKICWMVELGGTIHNGCVPVFYTDANGNNVDGSYYWTTGGLQATGKIGYALIRTRNHELQTSLGPMLRYQSTSYPDELTVIWPAAGTGLPFPVIALKNNNPARTFSIGGNGAIAYNYSFDNLISIGILGSFQIDTNGDTISQIAFTLGKRF
jgi:hypothetical protein